MKHWNNNFPSMFLPANHTPHTAYSAHFRRKF